MRFHRYVAFSIVTCSLLSGANYSDWTSTNNTLNGDTITIDYSSTPPTPPATSPAPLSSNLTVSGNSTATISGDLSTITNACGYVACWNGNASINGNGSITFTINAPTTNTLPAFLAKGILTAQAGITINGSGLPSTIFEAQSGATFSGDLTINADTNTTAIKTNSGALSLGNNGNKTINITGNLELGGSATINLKSGSSITGNITSADKQTLTLASGATITGNITQTRGSGFSLTMNGGTIDGDVNITSNGTNTISDQGNGGTITSLTLKGTNNKISNGSWKTGLTIQNLILDGTNNIDIQGTIKIGTLTTKGNTSITTYSSSSFQSIEHSGGSYTQQLFSNSKVSNGITATNASTINITINDNSKINGTSTMQATGKISLTFNGNSGGENFTLQGSNNTLVGTGTNTLTSVSMTATGTNSLTAEKVADKNGFTTGSLTIKNNVTMSNGTTNTLGTVNGGKLQINGNATLSGTNNTITFENGGITGKLTTTGTTTATLSNSSKIENGINTTGATTIDITLNNNSQINGSSSLTGTGNVTVTLKDTSSGGSFALQGANNTLTNSGTNNTLTSVSMTGNGTNKLLANGTTLTVTGDITMNGVINLLGTPANQVLNIEGNATLSATNQNTILFNNGKVGGTLKTSGLTQMSAATGTSFGKIEHSNGKMSQASFTSSTIHQGITTLSTTTAAYFYLYGTTQVNGQSNLSANSGIQITMKDQATMDYVTFNTPINLVYTYGINTITELSMLGINGGNANRNDLFIYNNPLTITTNLVMNGGSNRLVGISTGKIQVAGNATLSGENTIDIQNSSIGGTLTTQGTTKIQPTTGTTIGRGMRHSDGNLTAFFGINSIINGGIITTGKQGNAVVNLSSNAKLNGDSSFDNDLNNVTLLDTAGVNGDLAFAGNTNSLVANTNSTIQGQVISNGGTSNYTFSNDSTLTGGIDTNTGATQTTTIFQGSSILKSGTSNFHSNINITFKDNTQVQNENFNIHDGTSNIDFQNNATMTGGTITTSGGTSNINFTNSTEMINSTISTTGGTANLTANSNAELSNTFTQSGGTFNVKFKDQAKFTGTATQSGGTSDIKFENSSSFIGDFTQSGGNSTIKFSDTAHMEGNINTKGGTTNITFDSTSAYIQGNIYAGGSKNDVTFNAGTKLKGDLTLDGWDAIMGDSKGDFTTSEITGNVQGYDRVELNLTETQVGGYVHQGPSSNNSGMKGTFVDSKISGGFQGERSINKLDVTNSQIDKGVAQIGGSLDADIQRSVISGGFSGTSNSENTLLMTQGSLSGGISQNTGTLDVESDRTSISGGFTGTSSDNTMLLMNVNFNAGDIKQTRGSLKGDIIGTTALANFNGENSTNILQITHSPLVNIDQSGGGLTLSTDSDITGYVKGVSNSANSISTRGSTITGEVLQNTGSMTLQTFNTTASNISMQNATFSLQADTTTATNLTLTSSTSTGTANAFHLTGAFSQTNGTSSLIFTGSTFDKDSTLSNANATLSFTGSNIQNITANNGTSSITLSNSTMQDFSGTRGAHSLTLSSSSSANEISQSMGSITLSASSSSTINGDVTAKGFATISVSLSNSTANKSILNTTGGEMTVSAIDSQINENIKQQSGGNLSLSLTNSTIQGQYYQLEGISNVNSLNSKIQGGIDLTGLNPANLNFDQTSKVSNGLKSTRSNINFDLLGGSSIEGGNGVEAIKQDAGELTGNLNRNSSIKGDISLQNGISKLYLYGESDITGNISATGNTTTILVDNSSINGDMTISGGSLDLTAQNHTTIQGNTAGTKSQIQISDADFALTVDSSSTFNGDITQTNGKQSIVVQQNSTLNGDINNTNTTSTIKVENATLKGNVSQEGGTLAFDLSNKGIITGNVSLTDVSTTLSGLGTQNAIQGSFTQDRGDLTGTMHGLTLGGEFKQNNGISNAVFVDSTFNSPTTITNATSSSLTFNHSTLKDYTTDGGNNNTLSLINHSTMSGILTLTNATKTTLNMQDSTINGRVRANTTAISGDKDSTLSFNTTNSTITGAITFDTGGITGTTNSTTITGNITLTNTTSNASFTNTSAINGTLSGSGGDNTIKFDNSSITGDVSQTNGSMNLDLSNGSSIGRNLIFTTTSAKLTGKGENNVIAGYFLSEDSTLRGDISGLNLKGTFTQNAGDSSIAFRNDSLFEGLVTVDGGNADLNFLSSSGIRNNVILKNTTRSYVGLLSQSFIEGNININDSQSSTISAQTNSTIKGNFTSNNSTSYLSLGNQSSFEGTTTQTQGSLDISASGNSTITSNLTLNNGTLTKIALSTNSTLTGTITSDSTPLQFTLANGSSFNSQENPLAITINNANSTITASENSIFAGNLTQSSATNNTALLSFSSGSSFVGSMEFENIALQANFEQSTITSPQIQITAGSAIFDFNASNGTIQSLNATDTDLTINTRNGGHITITDLAITGNSLSLNASNSARFTSSVTLDGATTATYTASTNGNLNVDTTIKNTASTLTANISGGILQGQITQERGANGFGVGEITLQSVGDDGGRWLITGDSQIKTLTLNNTQEAIASNAVLASPFKTPLSVVDFTTERDDDQIQSRIGKAIIAKPEPIAGQPIPDAGEGQTYARQLQLNEIKGNNGLFRVYADLGSNLADNILANQASGQHLIQVYYRADTFREIGGDRIVVAKVTDGGTSVDFKGTQSEIGVTRYNTEIIKENAKDGNGFEWIIGQATPAGISYSSKIVASILQNQYRSFLVEIDSLDRRMGDLEFINRDKGLWIRSYIGSNTKEATDFSISAKDDYYSIWSGFDFNSIGLTVHNYAGVFFNYTGITSESKDYIGKVSNIAFGIYNTFKAFSGFYADLLAKYIYSLNEYEISNYSLAKNSPKFDSHKFLLNAEIGYSFYYGEQRKSGYIQPQFQVTSGYIHKTDLSFIDASGETINASLGRNFPVSLRVGAFWGQVFGEKFKSHIKLGTSVVYDVDSGGDLTLKDSSDQISFKQEGDIRWLLSAHADFTFNDFFKMYTSFDTSFFGNYNTTYSFNIGLRFTFGRPNNVVANVPMVYSPYTPPVIINDDHRTVPVVKNYTTKDIDQNYVGKPRKVESYIQGNPNTNPQQYTPTYSSPPRQPHRDITEIVNFGAQP